MCICIVFVRLFDIYYEHPRLLLVLELVPGGELFDRIVSREYFTEKCARDIIREALTILCYLHGDAKVVHRDLKPENFIMISGCDILDISPSLFTPYSFSSSL